MSVPATACADVVTVVTSRRRPARPAPPRPQLVLPRPSGRSGQRRDCASDHSGHGRGPRPDDQTDRRRAAAHAHRGALHRLAGRRSDDGSRGDQRVPWQDPPSADFAAHCPATTPNSTASGCAPGPCSLVPSAGGQHPAPACRFGPRRAFRRQRPSVLVGWAAPVPREAAGAAPRDDGDRADDQLPVRCGAGRSGERTDGAAGSFPPRSGASPGPFTPLDVTDDAALSAPREVSISR